MKVENFQGVKNQFILFDEGNGSIYFQSYNSVIAMKCACGPIKLDSIYWNYSKTTSKYRALFLGESTKETQAKINSGEYILCNLN